MPVRTTIVTPIYGHDRRRPAFEVRGTFLFEDSMPVGEAALVEALERIMFPLQNVSLRKAFSRIVQELAAAFPSMISGDLRIRKPYAWAPWFKERANATFDRARH